MTAKLRESTTLDTGGAKRRIRLISEGQGSSGLYEAAVLQRDGAAAWPKGTHIFLDHLTESEDEQRQGSHSIKDLVGVTQTPAEFENGALFAEAVFFSNFAPLIEEMRPYIDLSIEAGGTIHEGVIESIHPSPLNAISIVPRGGRDGKILELVESFKESGSIGNVNPDAPKVREDARKDKGMTPEEKTELIEAVKAAITAGFTEIKESLVPAKPVVEDAEADVAAVTEAIVVAFPNSEQSRKRVYEALKTNPDVAVAIEAEKTLVESVKADLEKTDEDADDTTFREGAKKNDYDYTGGW